MRELDLLSLEKRKGRHYRCLQLLDTMTVRCLVEVHGNKTGGNRHKVEQQKEYCKGGFFNHESDQIWEQVAQRASVNTTHGGAQDLTGLSDLI